MDEYPRSLTEKDSIVSTVNRLFIHTDNCVWENVKECFADEVLLDMTNIKTKISWPHLLNGLRVTESLFCVLWAT